MISAAYVKNPEHDDPTLPFLARYSASVYSGTELSGEWSFDNSFIFGLITKYDRASALASFGEEFLFRNDRSRIFGRIEVLQRTPSELGIAAAEPDSGRWVIASTVGYTYALLNSEEGELGLGASVTRDFLPDVFRPAYGGEDPWAGKVFLRVSGMRMWDL
jgi:hypothetical protein